ncbi:hypothetical protein, partial [Streptosporangium sp. H16]|uniref:hypothetical protein n=1 Tax=Streptosporangium sp. H16 TaxID=3444184 RepID=UPI003F7AE143
ERRRRDVGRWLLLGVFIVAVMGAKATHLPPLAAGLAAVVGVEVIRRRRAPRAALAALGMTAACSLFAQAILFGGARQGMMVDPLSLLRRAWGELTGHAGAVEPPTLSVLGVTVLYALCLAVTWCGILGLLCRPRLLLRPAVVLLLGMGAACVAAVLLLGHPHLGQLYFFGAGYPYLMIVAVYGLSVVVRQARVRLRTIVYAVGAGVTTAYLIRMLCDVRTPLAPGQPDALLYLPYAALLAVAVLVAAALVTTGRGSLRAWAFVLVMFAAAGPPAAWFTRVFPGAESVPAARTFGEVPPVAFASIPRGALEAGRWLRAHSDPGDLVATDVHCRWGYEDPCDSRQFWVAALSERRVLVEGWTYTSANMSHWRPGSLPEHLPFWDGERIRSNDAAFQTPSAAAIQHLRERYGVRWLLADERRTGRTSKIGDTGNTGNTGNTGDTGDTGDIGDFAELRFRSGDYAVYRIPDGSA